MKKILLTQGKYSLVDDEDFEYLNQFLWCFDGNYAVRRITVEKGVYKKIYLHHVIFPIKKGFQVDHKNTNKLDNQKNNLRYATHAENVRNKKIISTNTTGYKGVTFNKRAGKFVAQITVNNKNIFLGYFIKAEEAAVAFDLAATKFYKKFANLNFV